MCNVPTTVPPFYDQEQSGASPLFPPMLMDQLKLLSSIHCPTTLIADEIIVSFVMTPPTLAPEFKIAKCIHSDSQGSSNYSFDSDSSTSITPLSEDSNIPKPPGEPGRPGHGGYTLYDALNWSPKEYAKFKKFMYDVISKDLTMTQCTSAQSPAQLEVVWNKAIDKFPDLENYSDLWPVNDIILTRLKYMSRHVMQKEQEMTVSARLTEG
ncbi:uncharacterized protein EDB91DRAFT_1249483 [Suillus paluster]|uniref:uncharacterized protein n=1 Tax=Suillus paluster TaxID=48578 RepID=UPI001B87116C|nr:uncharacterized protein EDB91DRAFT_1249483 [Suillus paluster]KAG1738161.1 hypothetical protein EDB91DRAFT_1249483 [Suillus paluster]